VADYRAPVFASADTILDKANIGAHHLQVLALSPSHQDGLDARQAFASYFVPIDEPATGLSPIRQNLASVVISIQVDQEFLLLGADLERTDSGLTGWNAVVASAIRPQELSILFKIPHHGSDGAQLDSVWERMLIAKVYAAVTPYLPSGLPRDPGVRWLLRKTDNLYATGLPSKAKVKRPREVEKTIRESTLHYSAMSVPKEPGTVRFRKPISGAESWSTELFGDAKRLV
jgi:hypothetical protein